MENLEEVCGNRFIAPQPLLYGKTQYNLRRLSELWNHLANAGMTHLASPPPPTPIVSGVHALCPSPEPPPPPIWGWGGENIPPISGIGNHLSLQKNNPFLGFLRKSSQVKCPKSTQPFLRKWEHTCGPLCSRGWGYLNGSICCYYQKICHTLIYLVPAVLHKLTSTDDDVLVLHSLYQRGYPPHHPNFLFARRTLFLM